MDPTALGSRAGIHRLRVRGSVQDAFAARRRLERLLGAADPGDAGLPPGAIAIVRRILDPLPGTLSVQRDDAGLPPAWESALAAQVRAVVARAAWPARGPVPPDAPAVAFASAAELWSCLALDLARGVAQLLWWWQGIGRRGPLRAQLVARWLDEPELVPPAIDLAARRDEAPRVVALLDRGHARQLALSMCERFGLTALAAGVAEPEIQMSRQESPGGGIAHDPAFAAVASEVARIPQSREHRALLSVALVVHRAPRLARGADVAAVIARWIWMSPEEPRRLPAGARGASVRSSTMADPPPASPERAATIPEERPQPSAPVAAAPALQVQRSLIQLQLDGSTPALSAAQPLGAEATSSGEAVDRTRPAPDRPPPATSAATSIPAAADRTDPPAQSRGPQRPVPATAPRHASVEPGPARAEEVRTALGGAFYLLRLALWLELYGDFTRPRAPCLPFSPWDFVALLARALLGGNEVDDRIWELLDRLAQRPPGTSPGHDFAQPDEYRVRRGWLAPFARAPLAWDVRGGRLRLAHASGFLVLDAPARYDPRAEAEALGLPLGDGVELTDPGGEGAAWYFARLAPYADARLRAGLGLDAAADLPALLLRRAARVHVAAERVDVTLALAELLLPVRFAGLDQDIGWLPAAGRSIAFHFE